MTINLQVFPGFCQILDVRAVHWWACVQMLDTGVWSPDNATRTICRYMYLSCRVWLSHVCFFIVKCLTLFFRVYSEWQWILSGVLSLNPSLKRTNFQKKKKTKEREKKQWITFYITQPIGMCLIHFLPFLGNGFNWKQIKPPNQVLFNNCWLIL